jgi:hypothetical protein
MQGTLLAAACRVEVRASRGRRVVVVVVTLSAP